MIMHPKLYKALIELNRDFLAGKIKWDDIFPNGKLTESGAFDRWDIDRGC